MKIAIIASNRKPVPSSRDNVFAPGSIIKGLVDNLTKFGHEVVFFGPSDSKVNASRIISEGLRSVYSDYKDIRRDDPHTYLENEDQYEMALVSRAFEVIKNEGDFDIIHAHKYNKEVYFSNFVDTPLLISGHGMYCESINSPAAKIRFKRYGKSCYWVYVSDYHKKDVNLNFVAKIPWGVNPEAFPFNPKGGDNFLFLSRMIKRKRPHFAIEVAKLAGEKLILAGQKGVEGSHVKYWKSIEHLFKLPHVTFTDHIPFDQTYKYFGKAKALLLPLEIGEPMPVTSLEAMACGTPVIASNIPPMDEIVIDGETGFLVNKDDKNAWVSAIKNIGKINRSKCRARFEKEYTWQKMAERYLLAYKKVIELDKKKKRKK